jgi:hypothetical protein
MIEMTIVSIREVLEQQSEGQFEGWLYLPPPPWTLATEGIFMMEDINADPNEKFPPLLLAPCNLTPALDAAGIEDVIAYAEQKIANPSTEKLFESFKFYVENDAFLD